VGCTPERTRDRAIASGLVGPGVGVSFDSCVSLNSRLRFDSRCVTHLSFGFRRGRLRFRRAGEGIRPGAATSLATTAFTPPAAPATIAAFTASALPATTAAGGLGALLLHQGIQLTVFEHLAEGAHGKAEHGHGGAEIEGLLKRPGGAHFVIAQANAEATALPVALATSTATATEAASATTLLLAATATRVTLTRKRLGIAVGIRHGLRPCNQGQV
jgi:hypothetical protein